MTDIVSTMIAAISGQRAPQGQPRTRVGMSAGRAIGLSGNAGARERNDVRRYPMGPTAFSRDAQPLTTEQLREPSVQTEPSRFADQARRSRLAGRQPQTGIDQTPRDALPADFPLGPGGAAGRPQLAPTQEAADVTGAPREYLDVLIGHESGGDATAKAPTSTATGHGQFIESTWRRMMNTYGPRYGFGRGELANLSERDVQELRTDPRWSALMTAHYAQENAADLRARLGRPVTEGDVYLAHFLGSGDAASLIREAGQRNRRASTVVSSAAVEANRNIFYDRSGRARSASEVVQLQTRNFRDTIFRGALPEKQVQP